uniref:Uncharacterized protein n=1 Tax=Schizaphis graminum TaxID=13262 RepID=A0A2S2PVR8_SCHGA
MIMVTKNFAIENDDYDDTIENYEDWTKTQPPELIAIKTDTKDTREIEELTTHNLEYNNKINILKNQRNKRTKPNNNTTDLITHNNTTTQPRVVTTNNSSNSNNTVTHPSHTLKQNNTTIINKLNVSKIINNNTINSTEINNTTKFTDESESVQNKIRYDNFIVIAIGVLLIISMLSIIYACRYNYMRQFRYTNIEEQMQSERYEMSETTL